MRRLKTWSRRLLGALLLLLLLGLGLLAYYIWFASPQHSGERSAVGLAAAAQIERDAHGVPTVKAASVADLAFAMGFAHAQDRGWQLELQRRVGQGRLAEAFGAGALETDRFLRALGVRRAAKAQWAWVQQYGDVEARDALIAYARGVNAGWRGQARPPEMLILGLEFEEWTPVDSMSWALLMAWDLATNWNQELLRFRLALQLPGATPQRVHELLPPYPGDQYPAMDDFVALYASLGLSGQDAKAADARLERLQAAAPPSGIEGVGSNNWAVAASRSLSGQPLLANDPHLGLQTPALWYLARLQAPGLKVAGGTLPGLPWVVLGQNEKIAWAFTNTGPDTQDLYLEELRDAPGGGTEIRTTEGWQKAEEIEEVIRIKGGGSETLKVRIGRHGPLISDAGPGQELLKTQDGRRFGLALRWIALDPDQDPLGVGLALNRAPSIDAYFELMRRWHSPQQNMLLAERGGDIAFIAPAKVPVRKPAHRLHGLLPAPGWLADYDWLPEPIPFEQLPMERAPARGWLASANQKIHGADYQPHLSHEWATPFRQQRIEQLLQAREKHDLSSLAAMQADELSLGALPLLPAFKAARGQHPLFAQVSSDMQAFDGRMAADSRVAPLFWAWVRQLTQGLLADDMGQALYERALGSNSFRNAVDGIVTRQDATWCDDRRTAVAESCAQQADAALDRALAELQERLGDDTQDWRWDQMHRMKAEHKPFSRVAPLRPLFELSSPSGGDTYTVNVARVRLRADWVGDFYTNDHGPSLRALYEPGAPDKSLVMISTGQSGLPWSRHYSDQLAPWLRVEFMPLWSAPAVDVLSLTPG
jgi:penicillin amidase